MRSSLHDRHQAFHTALLQTAKAAVHQEQRDDVFDTSLSALMT